MALEQRQRYAADVARAGVDLSNLKASPATRGDPQVAASLAAVSTGLPAYAGYVAQAQTYNALGFPVGSRRLEVGVIVSSLAMAAGCAWGLTRRLVEYR